MKVVLTITGSQRFGTDEPEKTSLVTEGTLEREGDILLLSYEESELTGMEGTTTVFRVEPDAQPDAAGIGAAPAGDHGADGKGHRRRRLRGGAGQLYRRAHRRGGRQGLCMGAGYPVLRRFDA